MDFEDRLQKEQEINDRLANEIADLKAKAGLLLSSAESRPRHERGSAVKKAVHEIAILLGGPLEERQRQKKESDERLAALRLRAQSESALSKRNQRKPAGTASQPLLLKYRSPVKRGILTELIRYRRAKDLEICRGLDADGAVELPDKWKKDPGDRLFYEAYMDPHRRHKVENAISRVRAALRNRGLLPRQ